MKWRNLLMPTEIGRDEEVAGPSTGKFVIEPLERGFGQTVGNALRRTLLSSIQGAAVTAVRMQGVLHELSNIPGVLEDVTDIILNLKQLVVVMHCDDPKFLTLNVEKEGEVTAADIEEVGLRIMCQERLFNMREGITQKDDTLPARLLEEPRTDGPTKGEVVPLEELKKDYYEAMGYDPATGNPPDVLLGKLGIEK